MKSKSAAKIVKADSSLWQEYKLIRVESLKEDQAAFGSSYEEAIKHKKEYWIDFLKDQNNIVLLAFHDNVPIGIMRAALVDEDTPKGTAFIGSAYVNVDHRGKGVGRKLMWDLINEIGKHKEISAIRLWVNEAQKPAIELYKSFGFKEIGKEVNEELINELIFEKTLH